MFDVYELYCFFGDELDWVNNKMGMGHDMCMILNALHCSHNMISVWEVLVGLNKRLIVFNMYQVEYLCIYIVRYTPNKKIYI